MSERRDKGGARITDYSQSPMDPKRAKLLNAAELDYVNGMADEEDPSLLVWPTYGELAAKYAIPLRVVQEQANKHRWVSRREQRKTALIVFKNEQTRKRWHEMDRHVMGVMQENLTIINGLVARILWEHTKTVEAASIEEQERMREGDIHAMRRAGLPSSELESLARTMKNIGEAQKALSGRISELPTSPTEVAPPQRILTVQQEEEQKAENAENSLPLATVQDIYREILALEASKPKVIVGEFDDEEEEAPVIEIMGPPEEKAV